MYQQIFKKQLKVGSPESINKIPEKYLQRNLYFRKLFCICEQNPSNALVKELFFQFTILLVIFVIVLLAPLLKCSAPASVYHLETCYVPGVRAE